MAELTVGPPRGILYPTAGSDAFRLGRYVPSPDLAPFVERYWVVAWDRQGREPYPSETLPHPCVNLVVEDGRSGVFGVPRGKFSRLLTGAGRVFGVKFRPGGFYPFWGSPVSALTDRVVGLGDAFGSDGDDLERAILSLSEDAEAVAVAESFLRGRRPERGAAVESVAEIVACAAADPAILRVEDLADRAGMSVRTLQRLFDRYVGVSPKRVIRYYRLHEAADRLSGREPADLPRLALDLGYVDQAHFAKDFRSVVGIPPAAYARHVRAGQGALTPG